MQFGRYYEEFEVGATYKHWPGKTVTEYDDHLFCLLTMNHHPLHLDANYAEQATDFGQNLTLFLAGSFLIENIFDIDGFGLLGYNSTLDRDYPVVMGVLLLSSLLLLLGNLISDALVALADPRIRFG